MTKHEYMLKTTDKVQGRKIKCLVCTKLGDPTISNNLSVQFIGGDVSEKTPCPPHCVRISVRAASLNFADALQIQGEYQEKKKTPFVPGSECSGVIIELGRDVDESCGLRIGDAVCGVTEFGAFAEEAIAPAVGVIKIPRTADLESAAGLPIVFGTAMMGLQKAGIENCKGQTVLVLGAAGGVGAAAVQIAKYYGARVIAVLRGKDKASLIRDLGADVCVDTNKLSTQEIKSAIKREIKAADIVFDPVGGSLGSLAFSSLTAWGGHVVVVGFASGSIQEYKSNIALVKNITIHGLYWGSHMYKDPKVFRKSLEDVQHLFSNGDIVVPVSHVYALEQAKEAFQVLKNRSVVGKLLLIPKKKSML